jgi:hypothetical protein
MVPAAKKFSSIVILNLSKPSHLVLARNMGKKAFDIDWQPQTPPSKNNNHHQMSFPLTHEMTPSRNTHPPEQNLKPSSNVTAKAPKGLGSFTKA